MTGPPGLADLVEDQLDLRETPFGLLDSRLFLLETDGALALHTAEYERRAADCVVLRDLVVRDGQGRAMPVRRVRPERVEFAADDGVAVVLTFAGPHAVSLSAPDVNAWEVAFRTDAPVDDDGVWRPGLPSAPVARLRASDGAQVTFDDDAGRDGERTNGEDVGRESLRAADGGGTAVRVRGSGAVVVAVGNPPRDIALDAVEHLRSTTEVWDVWFARCPQVRADLRPTTALCWWVLGLNTVRLREHGGPRVVVPSLLGYVALWQWDAYFIACGLRHGAPELAAEQLDVAVRFQGPDGQLPDVVHDEGVLASSADMPPQVLIQLREAGSAASGSDAVVPLTKPPLTAWAVDKLSQVGALPESARPDGVPGREDGVGRDDLMAAALRSQRWWYVTQDTDDDGLPEYGHPYSSGLDDSPIFDHALPVTSPDLLAYLVRQDNLLAAWAQARGDDAVARECRQRADRTFEGLLGLWDAEQARFAPRAGGRRLPEDTAVGLLPLLLGDRLPATVRDALAAALDDPDRFAASWSVPTVAVGDPAYAPDRMWRGPVWVNVAAMLVEGLHVSGHEGKARRLAERTLEMVVAAGNPYEYFDPVTAARVPTATSCFGWSAALFVDLAVAVSR